MPEQSHFGIHGTTQHRDPSKELDSTFHVAGAELEEALLKPEVVGCHMDPPFFPHHRLFPLRPATQSAAKLQAGPWLRGLGGCWAPHVPKTTVCPPNSTVPLGCEGTISPYPPHIPPCRERNNGASCITSLCHERSKCHLHSLRSGS